MVKRLIVMHGRAIKPARAALADLAQRAIASGLRRAGAHTEAKALAGNDVKFASAYYGDISNALLVAANASTLDKLKARDPDAGDAPCFDAKHLESAFQLTDAYADFERATYRKVLKVADDLRFLDEFADVASVLGSVLTGAVLNRALIRAATADMSAYLESHRVGTTVRARLDEILRPALLAGDDIMLLTHSMGCIVAYDVLWKYSHMAEYEDLRRKAVGGIRTWLTFGCPLGEDGVRRNLLDGRYTREDERHPRNRIVRNWVNVYAEDDYISRAEKLKPVYGHLVKSGDLDSLVDLHLYNCWVYNDESSGRLKSNPHDFYGYMMNPKLANYIAEWIAA